MCYLLSSRVVLVIFNSFTRPFYGEWKSRLPSSNRIKETFYNLLCLEKKISMKMLRLNLDFLKWRGFDKINRVSFCYNKYNGFLYKFYFKGYYFTFILLLFYFYYRWQVPLALYWLHRSYKYTNNKYSVVFNQCPLLIRINATWTAFWRSFRVQLFLLKRTLNSREDASGSLQVDFTAPALFMLYHSIFLYLFFLYLFLKLFIYLFSLLNNFFNPILNYIEKRFKL